MDQGNIFTRLYNQDRVLELVNIFEITYTQLAQQYSGGAISFLKLARSLRVQKIRKQISQAKFYYFRFHNMKNEDVLIKEIDTEQKFKGDDQLQQFIISATFDLINGIFIESTFLLAIDKALNYEGFTEENLDYIRASYYILVSLSTIGYGDIYAIHWFSRLGMVILLIINITVMSKFLGEFTELYLSLIFAQLYFYRLFQLSSFNTYYQFQDHIVILGEYENYFIADFCGEVAEIDILFRQLDKDYGNPYREEGRKVIIIGQDDPSNQMRGVMNYYEQGDLYDNEIRYLKADIYGKNKIWYKKANLEQAKHVLALSMKFVPDQNERENMDKKITLTVKEINMTYQSLKISLVLQSDLADNFQSDPLYQGIKIAKIQELSQYILSSSIENQGFGTILTHILTMKLKNQPIVMNQQSLYSRYVDEMAQEIYQFKFPPIYYGKTFKEVKAMLYIYSLHLGGDAPLTRHMKEDDRGLLLISVQTQSNNKKEMYINPYEYVIQQGDIGYENFLNLSLYISKILLQFENLKLTYVVCYGYQDLQKALKMSDTSTNEYKRYEENLKFLMKSTKDKAKNKRLIDEMFLNQMDMLSNFKLTKFDLKFKKLHIVKIVRKQTDRPIILFCQNELDDLLWNKIVKNHKNIYYVQGSFLNIHHIDDLNLTQCHKALILSDQDGIVFNDSDVVVLTKIIFDHYQCQTFLIELRDEGNIKFLSVDPNLRKHTNISSGYEKQQNNIEEINKQKDAASFFWTSFVQGNVFFSSVSATVLARDIYNPDWMNFIYDLIIPESQDNKQYHENKLVNSLVITKEVASHFELYGVLQYSLMNQSPTIIALGLIKNELNQSFKLKRNGIYKRSFGDFNKPDINNVLYKYGGFLVVLTNPSFYTPLEKGDTVIVFGLNRKIQPGTSMKDHVLKRQTLLLQDLGHQLHDQSHPISPHDEEDDLYHDQHKKLQRLKDEQHDTQNKTYHNNQTNIKHHLHDQQQVQSNEDHDIKQPNKRIKFGTVALDKTLMNKISAVTQKAKDKVEEKKILKKSFSNVKLEADIDKKQNIIDLVEQSNQQLDTWMEYQLFIRNNYKSYDINEEFIKFNKPHSQYHKYN